MIPAELHAYVVARWTEYRALAEVASPGPWDRSFTSLHMNGSGTALIAPVAGGRAVVMGHFPNGADPDHIVANDPSHVIAVCDAALRRLARHAPLAGESGCVVCLSPRVDYVEEWERLPWPCDEVLDDAAPWADRPDFPRELQR